MTTQATETTLNFHVTEFGVMINGTEYHMPVRTTRRGSFRSEFDSRKFRAEMRRNGYKVPRGKDKPGESWEVRVSLPRTAFLWQNTRVGGRDVLLARDSWPVCGESEHLERVGTTDIITHMVYPMPLWPEEPCDIVNPPR